MRREWRLLGVLAVVSFTGCTSYYPVPLRDGVFPATAVQVGERVQVVTRGGESSSFQVAGVDGGSLTGTSGERIAAGDVQSLQVQRLNRKNTFITLGVIGGIVGTALLLDVAEDVEDCFDFGDCEE